MIQYCFSSVGNPKQGLDNSKGILQISCLNQEDWHEKTEDISEQLTMKISDSNKMCQIVL